jgi:hypothetical protein
MTQEQREEIERAIHELEMSHDIGILDSMTWPDIEVLARFARQQLNLRVDGEKLLAWMTALGFGWKMEEGCIEEKDAVEVGEIVMECLTTEEKE